MPPGVPPPAGYECKEINGSFMAAFGSGCDAVEWAITLHLALAGTAIAQEALERTKLPRNVALAAAKLVGRGVFFPKQGLGLRG